MTPISLVALFAATLISACGPQPDGHYKPGNSRKCTPLAIGLGRHSYGLDEDRL